MPFFYPFYKSQAIESS